MQYVAQPPQAAVHPHQYLPQQAMQQPKMQQLPAGYAHYQGPPQQLQQHFAVRGPPSVGGGGTPTHGSGSGGGGGFVPMLPRSAAPTPPAPLTPTGAFGSTWSMSSSAFTGAVTPCYTPHGDAYLPSGTSQASMCMSSNYNEPWKQFSDSMTSFKVVPGLAQPTLSMSRTTVGSRATSNTNSGTGLARQHTGGSVTPAGSVASQSAGGPVTTPRMVTVVSNGGKSHSNGKLEVAPTPGGSIVRIASLGASQAPSASGTPRVFTPGSRTNSIAAGTTTTAATMLPVSSTARGAFAMTPSGSSTMQAAQSRDSVSVVSTPRRVQVVPLSRMAMAPTASQPSLSASTRSNANSAVRLISAVSGGSGAATTGLPATSATSATFVPMASAGGAVGWRPAGAATAVAPLSVLASQQPNQAVDREESANEMQSLPSFGPGAADVSAILPETEKEEAPPSAEPSRISSKTSTTPRRERTTGSARAGSACTRRSSAASLTPRQQRAELAAVERQRVGRERSISARRELLGVSASFMGPPFGPDVGEKSLETNLTKDGSVIWAGASAEAALEMSSVTGRRTCSTLQVSADFMAGVCQDRQQQYGGDASTLGTENRAPWHYSALEERRASSVSRQVSVTSNSIHGGARSADLVNSDWERSLKRLPPPEVVDRGASTPGRRRHSLATTAAGSHYSQYSGGGGIGGHSGIGTVLLEDLVLSSRNHCSHARPEQAASASLVDEARSAARRKECSTALFGNTTMECRELSQAYPRRAPPGGGVVRSQFLSSGSGNTTVCMMDSEVPRQSRSSSAKPHREVCDAFGGSYICFDDPSSREASRVTAPKPRSRLNKQSIQEIRDAYGCTQVFAGGAASANASGGEGCPNRLIS